MMTKEERIKIIANSTPTGESKSINYKEKNDVFKVVEISLDALLYNPHNGRIRSSIISFESIFHKLKPENEHDKIIIEQYLYDSAMSRNEKTIESLEKKGQQEVGIVTKDGVIIDGNRRALLLNIINKKNQSNVLFKAIVLPDELAHNEKEIILLETGYQMGVDSKVDYNPIEKYLRCRELNVTHKLSTEEIAMIMAEEKTRIEEWLSILKLMDEYLDSMNSPGVYTRLDKREGHFVDLNNYLKTYSKNSQTVKWTYTKDDTSQMKKIYFDYIRLGIPVQRARVIAKPTSSNSFFCQKNIWKEFSIEHEKTISSFPEPEFQKLKDAHPDKSNEDIIRLLDEKWKENIELKLYENLSYSEATLKDFTEIHAPVKILKRVLNNLILVQTAGLQDQSKQEAVKLLSSINSKVSDLTKELSS